MLVGFFSSKVKDFATRMASADEMLTARGANVVRQIVQRRGISQGGGRNLRLPFSSRTLLSSGKVREVAEACEQTGADMVVFVAAVTELQRRTLTTLLGRPAVSISEFVAAD